MDFIVTLWPYVLGILGLLTLHVVVFVVVLCYFAGLIAENQREYRLSHTSRYSRRDLKNFRGFVIWAMIPGLQWLLLLLMLLGAVSGTCSALRHNLPGMVRTAWDRIFHPYGD